MADIEPSSEEPTTSRRDFLQAASLAAGAALLGHATEAVGSENSNALLPTIKLGPQPVTRLIIGANPIYGYSHFNRLLSQHQANWHTPERVAELMRRCEEAGINTWQNSWSPRTVEDVERYRASGGRMQWLLLGNPDWDQKPEIVREAAAQKPMGIAPHGSLAERLHRQKKLPVLTDLLKRIRDCDLLVGLSAHNPALIELSEEMGWDVDYYMCCLYYLTRQREEFAKLLGPDLPLGEIYLPSDPPRMFKAIQGAKNHVSSTRCWPPAAESRTPRRSGRLLRRLFQTSSPQTR